MKCPKCGDTEHGVITGWLEPYTFHCWKCHYVCQVRYNKKGETQLPEDFKGAKIVEKEDESR